MFKYGHFNISHAVRFSGNINAYANEESLFEKLTSRMNIYDYSFEYLIIHFASEQVDGVTFSVDIENVKSIYAFDDEAKKEMSSRLDQRIQINVSPWADKFERLHEKHLVKQSMLGVKNIWAIFDLPQEDIAKCKDVISDDIINEAFRQFYSNETASGDLSIWNYLLRYERHSLYPKDNRGFYCDLIHVVCNWRERKTIIEDVAEQTEIYAQIIGFSGVKLMKLVNVMNNSPLATMTQEATGCEFIKAALLFLYMKAQYIDGMEHKPRKRIISYTKNFGLEGELALYLLGITLGYDKTYDAFYEAADISFFKKHEEPPIWTYNEVNETTTNLGGSSQLPLSAEKSDSSALPIEWVRTAKGDVRPVMTEKERDCYYEKDYTSVKQLTYKVRKAMESLGYVPETEWERLHHKSLKMKKRKN